MSEIRERNMVRFSSLWFKELSTGERARESTEEPVLSGSLMSGSDAAGTWPELEGYILWLVEEGNGNWAMYAQTPSVGENQRSVRGYIPELCEKLGTFRWRQG